MSHSDVLYLLMKQCFVYIKYIINNYIQNISQYLKIASLSVKINKQENLGKDGQQKT